MRLNSGVKDIRPEMMLETNGLSRSSAISSALNCYLDIVLLSALSFTSTIIAEPTRCGLSTVRGGCEQGTVKPECPRIGVSLNRHCPRVGDVT